VGSFRDRLLYLFFYICNQSRVMRNFFNILASGARSLSFEPLMTQKFKELDSSVLQSTLQIREPRSPAQILKEAWDNVGLHMWNAVNEIESQHGKQPD